MTGDEESKKLILEIAKRIAEQYEPKKIILYGSYAYGEPTQDSDVDLLIIKNTDKRPIDRWIEVKKLLRGVARGYLKGAGSFLTAAELRILPIAGMAMAFENAIRFLTDHLCGDVYFKIHRAGHNLDRSRTQLRLVELMDENRDAIRAVLTTAQVEILTRSAPSPR